jgi:hypothetical protein
MATTEEIITSLKNRLSEPSMDRGVFDDLVERIRVLQGLDT